MLANAEQGLTSSPLSDSRNSLATKSLGASCTIFSMISADGAFLETRILITLSLSQQNLMKVVVEQTQAFYCHLVHPENCNCVSATV
jgi:hypothetical protein